MKLSHLLVRYGVLEYLPVEKSVYLSLPIPENIKLTKELVEINYAKYAPFKHSDIIYLIRNGYIFLWFSKREEHHNALVTIPESYLVYKMFEKRKNIIVTVSSPVSRLFILKEDILKVAVSFQGNADTLVKVSRNEHHIDNILHLEDDQYRELLEEGKKAITLKDMFTFFRVDISPRTLIPSIVDKLTYPLVFLMGLYMAVSYLQSVSLTKRSQTLEARYQLLKQHNRIIKEKIKIYNNDVKKLDEFNNKELRYPDQPDILYALYRLFSPKDSLRIKLFQSRISSLSLRIETRKRADIYIEKLNRVNYFDQVILQNSYRRKDGRRIYIFDISLKAAHD